MSEILVLSPVGRIQSCLNIHIHSISILLLQPNPARQILKDQMATREGGLNRSR
jgi:hypothetical protein